MISCPTASCQGDRCPSFSGLSAIARPITPPRQLGNGTRLIIVCLSAPTRRLTARLHAKETTSMTIDVATGISRILKEEGVGWVSTFPVCRGNNALGREGEPLLMMRDDRYAAPPPTSRPSTHPPIDHRTTVGGLELQQRVPELRVGQSCSR